MSKTVSWSVANPGPRFRFRVGSLPLPRTRLSYSLGDMHKKCTAQHIDHNSFPTFGFPQAAGQNSLRVSEYVRVKTRPR